MSLGIHQTSASPILVSANDRAVRETDLYATAWLARAREAQQGAGADNTRQFLRIANFPDPCTTAGDINYISTADFDST
jgi:hypothetical protein